MKFNKKNNGIKTVNLAGGQAYTQSDKMQMITILLNAFCHSEFYKTEDDILVTLKELFKTIDKKFIAKTSLFSRLNFGLRSINHVIAAEIANKVKSEKWTKKYFEKIVHRVDDMSEILAYYFSNYGRIVPNALRKGFKAAFNKFNEYQLAKYKCENKVVKLIDVVNLIRPCPSEKNKNALSKLVKNELVSFDTWESELSKAGQISENEIDLAVNKKEVWVKLIKEKKIGYFALLRNLRNILQQAPELFDEVASMLTDKNLIKKSLVLPFRYFTALEEIKEISGSRKIIESICTAAEISLNNVPEFNGNNLIVIDVSGSMSGKCEKNARILGSILYKKCNSDLMTFDNNAKYINLNPSDSMLTIMNQIVFSGGGTNFHSIFETINKAYDRIIIFSDMQGWIGMDSPVAVYNKYKSNYKCNPKIYSFDLNGYGTIQFPENNVFCLAGYNDKIFEVMKLIETDKNALINEIEKIEL